MEGSWESQIWNWTQPTFTFHFHVLEKEMATHSSVLAWRIPGMVEPGGLPSMGSHRVGHYWSDLAAAAARVPWTARRSNQSILKEISPGISLEGMILKLKLQYLATSCEELTHWKRLWCCEGLGAGGEGEDRGWDGWMASLTRWTWIWVNSGSWWWTGRPGVLWFMGSRRVGHNWATELNWIIMIGQRKTGRNAPCKWFKLPHGHNSGIFSLSLPMCLSTCTVLLFFLINTLLASLLSLFVEVLSWKAEG